MKDRQNVPGKAIALRVRTDSRALRWFMGQILVGLLILATCVSLWSIDRELRSNPALWVGFAIGGSVTLGYAIRWSVESGAVPRLWIRPRGDGFKVWTVGSALRGAAVSGDSSTPLTLKSGVVAAGPLPMGPSSGWLILTDGRNRVGVISHSRDPQEVFDQIVAELSLNGVEVVQTSP